MHPIKTPSSSLNQLIFVLLFSVFCIVTFRQPLFALLYDIIRFEQTSNIFHNYTKISMSLAFIMLLVTLILKNIQLKHSDHIYIFMGFIFIIYNMIYFDFRALVNSIFYFLGVYLFYGHSNFYNIFHKLFIFTSLFVAFEILIEYIIFDGSQIGLDISVFGTYKEYITRFNPDNTNAGLVIGRFYRLDGIFGNHQLTGSYLAVSSAYIFGYISNTKYIYAFIINFIALILTMSTISLISFLISVLFFSLLTLNKKKLMVLFVLLIIIYNNQLVNMMANRLLFNAHNENYMNSFLFSDKGEIFDFIFGFNNGKNFENDLIELLYFYGIIPTLFLMFRYIHPIISFRKLLFRDSKFTSCSLAVVSGLITLTHAGGIIGWHIGLHFLFMSSILLNYSKQVHIYK
jgi:hypothetical protein